MLTSIPASDRAVTRADNGPPPDEAAAFTIEEALLVHEAAELWALKFRTAPNLITAKRGERRFLHIRKALALSLRGALTASKLAAVLGMDRSTIEDNQRDAEQWIERNPLLEPLLDAMCRATQDFVSARPELMEHHFKVEAARDIDLKRLAREAQEKEAAERRAKAEAEARTRRAQSAKRTTSIDAYASLLRERGVANWEMIAAQHNGASHTAQRLSTQARQGLMLLIKADNATKFQDRRLQKHLVPGIVELLRLGAAKDLTPVAKASGELDNGPGGDAGIPRVGVTAFGSRVYAALTVDPAQTPRERLRA